MTKLLQIIRSHKPEKKYDAVFENDGRKKVIPFGARGMSDYTKHHDKERRERYLKRHRGMGEDWNNPQTAGALSKYLLWGESTSLTENIRKFKSKFNL